MRFVPREFSGARWAIGAAVLALVATGCGQEPGASSQESPSASESAPTPGWAEVGGQAVTSPTATPDEETGSSAEPGVDPIALPVSCEDTGIEEHMSGVIAQLDEPESTEVRTDTRLECSWAGFDADEGSEVVMVTFAPENSLVAYPGHVPAKAQRETDFFTTDEVSGIGGVAQWDTGEMFSGVSLHVPGLMVSTTTNTARVETGDLLDAATATAGEMTADAQPGDGTESESPERDSKEDPDETLQADEGSGDRPAESGPD